MLVSSLYDLDINIGINWRLYKTVDLLQQAITDWPTEVKTIEDFLQNIEEYLHCTSVTINVVYKAISNVPSYSELWQVEALGSIHEIMIVNDQDDTLEEVIESLILFLK